MSPFFTLALPSHSCCFDYSVIVSSELFLSSSIQVLFSSSLIKTFPPVHARRQLSLYLPSPHPSLFPSSVSFLSVRFFFLGAIASASGLSGSVYHRCTQRQRGCLHFIWPSRSDRPGPGREPAPAVRLSVCLRRPLLRPAWSHGRTE